MTFIIIFLFAIGAWEAYVYYKSRYPEDIIITVGVFGLAMFLAALLLNGVRA